MVSSWLFSPLAAAPSLANNRSITPRSWDYRTKRGGVTTGRIFGPIGWDGQKLWAKYEQRETRTDAIFGRLINDLPAQVSDAAREKIVFDFCQEIRDLHGVGVEAWIHPPPRGGNGLNWHAHIAFTGRPISDDGVRAKRKIREWDEGKTRRAAVIG